MRTLLALLITLAPAAALADKDFTDAKGAAWDCKDDPTVNINTGGGTYTFKGACTAINVNGGSVKATIEAVDDLNLNGAKNTITVGTVATISINGASNKVTWTKAKSGDKPQITSNGVGNKVGKAAAAKPATKKG
jgi:hypothetical protein